MALSDFNSFMEKLNSVPKGEIPKECCPSKTKNSDGKGLADLGDSNLKTSEPTQNPKRTKIPVAECIDPKLPKEMCDAISVNPRMLEHLVNEMKNAGLLAVLVAELTNYREVFEHLAEVMGHKEYGPPVCDRLAKAISLKEDVAAPLVDKDTEEDEESDEVVGSEDDLDAEADIDLKNKMPKKFGPAMEHLKYSFSKIIH